MRRDLKMLSRTSKYALAILGYLASRQGVRVPGGQIAGELGVPANYLSKVLNQLRKQGIVDAEKGWGGGFELRQDALDRPIRDILEIIEGTGTTDPVDCLFGLHTCDAEHPCPLHVYWERIREIYAEMLSKTTIADLAT
jgi:Rrf2 family protein